ncbi:MAG: hypothetical protein A2173_03600 [Planctomycetes bacterium RBG_13_44_8b]|nr:MAG: hypothetical protein A2173_03600 [Planctomycetes bacterium RBG_13_44_8b]
MGDDFKKKVVEILKRFKFNFSENSDEFKISLYDKDKKIGFLRPITNLLGEDEENYVKLLSQWRSDNWQAYPTVFKVTHEGTRKWIKEQLVEREDRILFMIIANNNYPIGHLGLSNFNFGKKEAEIDNVVRGVKNTFPGALTLALNTVNDWAFNKLGLVKLFLRVFYDNTHAIKFYERCGFKGIKKIPLRKIVDGDVVKFEELSKDEESLSNRYFYLMELEQGR